MPGIQENPATDVQPAVRNDSAPLSRDWEALLERAYGVPFTILDGQTGDVLWQVSGQPFRDWAARAEVCREVARRGRPEFIDDEDPLLTLALPLIDGGGHSRVAVAAFLSRPLGATDDLSVLGEVLGISPDDALAWARRQTFWSPDALMRVSDLVLDQARARQEAWELRRETDSLSINLASTYEEISLLHRLTRNLNLSKTAEDLGRTALEWMEEVVPAAGLMLQLVPPRGAEKALNHAARDRAVLLHHGSCPLDCDDFSRLIDHLGLTARHQPMVLNRAVTERPDWPFPQIRELVVVALAEGENIFGWLAAINHVEGSEFGTVEAGLLSSVATILGIHGGNIELCRQQSELFAGIVRALTSAIDAKDPYTCGHSDRVARMAVRLAEELGCDEKTLNTLYLAGLLHDIGKIGVEDSILRKDGELSADEYAHIQQHVKIGHRILHDLAKLEDILPVVLYHHESWDGGGYPHNLDCERIPLPARIVAVADSFDAMSSDRPYRQGMPDEMVDRVLRQGAGQQWDPMVIDAFFRARDDIRRICSEEDETAGLDRFVSV
jgi:putative nucleotidyltransferase with HDIG domain